MSYAVTVEVVGDDGVLATFILDNFDDAYEAMEHAAEVCAQEYERTGIRASEREQHTLALARMRDL